MKLITEILEEVQIITEQSEDGKKSMYIEGVFLQSNLKNRNGRVYPESIMDKEVSRYMKEYVAKNRALGELGHPSGPSINLDRVSHMITDLKKESTNYVGRAKIMDTPMGNIARNLIESGAQLGVSSRGMGSLKQARGVMEVQDDFYLATAADIVADPSAPDAFVNGILEGVDWIWQNGTFKPVQLEAAVEEIEQGARSVSREELEEAKLRVWNNLIGKF